MLCCCSAEPCNASFGGDVPGHKGIGPDFCRGLVGSDYSATSTTRQVASYLAGRDALAERSCRPGEQGCRKPVIQGANNMVHSLVWLLAHPHSALARWFTNASSAMVVVTATTIVALARKLLVALWKYVSAGVVIEGAEMKAV